MGATVSYENPPEGGLRVAGGSSACFAIPYPARCMLSKILVIQTEGDKIDFDVDLFNHSMACGGDSISDATPPFTGILDEELFRVYATLSSDAPGHLAKYFAANECTFFNQDPEGPAGKIRKIYVKISPEGSGDKTFAVVIGSAQFLS